MSIFASQTSKTIAIPFDIPHTVIVRKMTGLECEQAQEAHRGSIATGRSRSWSLMFKRMLEKGMSASDPEVQAVLNDPLTGFDRYAVVRAGLIGWSYPQPIKSVSVTDEKTNVTTTTDAVADLDDESVDFIATEILRLTKPGLFVSADELAEARKNASGSSTAT